VNIRQKKKKDGSQTPFAVDTSQKKEGRLESLQPSDADGWHGDVEEKLVERCRQGAETLHSGGVHGGARRGRGRYKGLCSIGLTLDAKENPHMRLFCGLT